MRRPTKLAVSLALACAAVLIWALFSGELRDHFIDGQLRQYDVHDLLAEGAPIGSYEDRDLPRDPATGLFPSSGALACAVGERLKAASPETLVMYPQGIPGAITAYATWWGDRHVRAALDDLRDEQDDRRADDR